MTGEKTSRGPKKSASGTPDESPPAPLRKSRLLTLAPSYYNEVSYTVYEGKCLRVTAFSVQDIMIIIKGEKDHGKL